MRFKSRNQRRLHIKKRIRGKISGTAETPRLAVFKSLTNIYVQAIDDVNGVTIAQASSVDKELKSKITYGGNKEAAKTVGEVVAERLLKKGVEAVVFDRGGYVYHGRVKALADAAREKGLKF